MAPLACSRATLAVTVALVAIVSLSPGILAQDAPAPEAADESAEVATETSVEVGDTADGLEERKLGLLKLWKKKKTPSPKFGKWWDLDFKKATPYPSETTNGPAYINGVPTSTPSPSLTPAQKDLDDNWWKLDFYDKEIFKKGTPYPATTKAPAPEYYKHKWGQLPKYKYQDYDYKYYDDYFTKKTLTPAPKTTSTTTTTTAVPPITTKTAPIYKGVEYLAEPVMTTDYTPPYYVTTAAATTTTAAAKSPEKLYGDKFDWHKVCDTFKITRKVGGWDAYEYCWKASHTLCEKKKLKYFTCFWKDYTECTKCLEGNAR